jgi:hypothetical protein
MGAKEKWTMAVPRTRYAEARVLECHIIVHLVFMPIGQALPPRIAKPPSAADG